ncbi:MAG: hypothetical protein PQJ58_08740 [Spirochaetales bacterium]|nr:hypothetical protein [Spirochaetales bacterium]
MRITAKGAALVLPLLFVIGIGFTMLSGYWQTESSKIPVKLTTGDAAGEYDPGDIRGSYSLQDIENAFEIPVETLAAAFGLSSHESPATVQVKEFEESYGMIDGKEVGTDSMRYFVALYLNRPFVPGEDTALPRPAYNILKKDAGLSAEVLETLQEAVVSLESVHPEETAGTEEDHDAEEELEIKGKTLFSEVLDAGLSEEQVIEALGGIPMGPRNMTVRDYCMEQGIEFSGVKAALQGLLDEL